MKAYVAPPKGLSTAMFRVSMVLQECVPEGVQIVQTEDEADLLVLHVIGPEAIDYRRDKRVATIQYCYGQNVEPWKPLWERSLATWSYYDFRDMCPRFYHAPLGISGYFTEPFAKDQPRDIGIFTSGFVAGPGAEAIEECIVAATRLGQFSAHLGPRPERMSPSTRCNCTGQFIGDDLLADLYRRSRYVSGLRYVEGFELPALEGLACGARPIMFDRPDARQWFDGHAVFVPEYSGMALVRELEWVLKHDPRPVTPEERATVLRKFDWTDLADGFWRKIQEAM